MTGSFRSQSEVDFNMNKKNSVYIKIVFLFVLFLFASSQKGSAVIVRYPYSVKIGDKIDYHLDTLRNGTEKGTFPVDGLNLTEGDNFQLEVYDTVANPSSPIGADFTLRFDKGSDKSNTFSGAFFLYTSNETYWSATANQSFSFLSVLWSFSHTNTSATYSATQNADNFITVTFNPKDGLVTSYEAKSSSASGNYTHIKFTKGSGGLLSNIPGFEASSGLVALIFMATVAYTLKRKKL